MKVTLIDRYRTTMSVELKNQYIRIN